MSLFIDATNPLGFNPVEITRSLQALDVPVPDELNEIVALADAAMKVSPDRTEVDTLVADVTAGDITPDELPGRIVKAAEALVLKSGPNHPISQVRDAIKRPLLRRALNVTAAHAADIDQSLSAPLARAVEHLEAAAQVLGPNPPDPGRTPQGGPVIQEAIQRWQQGNDMLRSIVRIREVLTRNLRYGPFPMTATRWCELTTAADHDRFLSTTNHMSSSQLWRAVPAGFRLSIVSPERAAELDAAIAAERAEQERRRNQNAVKRHNKRVERELAAWRAVGVELDRH